MGLTCHLGTHRRRSCTVIPWCLPLPIASALCRYCCLRTPLDLPERTSQVALYYDLTSADMVSSNSGMSPARMADAGRSCGTTEPDSHPGYPQRLACESTILVLASPAHCPSASADIGAQGSSTCKTADRFYPPLDKRRPPVPMKGKQESLPMSVGARECPLEQPANNTPHAGLPPPHPPPATCIPPAQPHSQSNSPWISAFAKPAAQFAPLADQHQQQNQRIDNEELQGSGRIHVSPKPQCPSCPTRSSPGPCVCVRLPPPPFLSPVGSCPGWFPPPSPARPWPTRIAPCRLLPSWAS